MDEEKEVSAESEGIQADPPDYEVVGGEEEETIAEKLKKMREELKACRKEKEEYLAGWQRSKADAINSRKEDERAREAFIKFAEAGVLNDFISVADSLEMALRHLPAQAGKESEGTAEIYSQILEIFRQHGVTPIEAIGKKFNPGEHEAIDKVEVETQDKDNAVTEELQKGWYLHGKVLRPAKVKVGVLRK